MSEARQRYQAWLSDSFDEATRAELEALAGQTEEIEDRFYQDLQFGTAGLRGILGAGTNRMNVYTLARAAEGFAQYYLQKGREFCRRGLVISYDSRHFSRAFAELTARIFVSHGITVFFSNRLRPVPYLSFAIRHFGAAGGAMITASHNPRIYNGFKAYGEDGGQFPPEGAEAVAAFMTQVQDYPAVLAQAISWEACQKDRCFHQLGADLDRAYDEMVLKLRLHPEVVERHRDLAIVYTPLNGAGNLPVRRVLGKMGLRRVEVVPEQEEPNGDFTTCPYPNPEMREALTLGIELAEKTKADLLIATDPDADRTGVAVRARDGRFVVLSGNQIGILLMDYILGAKAERGLLQPQSFCVSTVVSSRLPKRICAQYEVDLALTLTGFKYINEQIVQRQEQGNGTFEFAYEESFGYLTGQDVRDKDAVVSSMLIAEMACVAAEQGQTLYDRLEGLYRRYAYGAEQTIALVREGKIGLERIQKAMSVIRESYEKNFPELPITAVLDFQKGERRDLLAGTTEQLVQDRSNVLIFELGDLDFVAVRPSGTEPKLKIYFGVYRPEREAAETALKVLREAVARRIEALLDA